MRDVVGGLPAAAGGLVHIYHVALAAPSTSNAFFHKNVRGTFRGRRIQRRGPSATTLQLFRDH